MTALRRPNTTGAHFTDRFGVGPLILESYGAFDLSIVMDTPLLIDPFLLFNGGNGEFQTPLPRAAQAMCWALPYFAANGTAFQHNANDAGRRTVSVRQQGKR